jgi:hypothetical protein
VIFYIGKVLGRQFHLLAWIRVSSSGMTPVLRCYRLFYMPVVTLVLACGADSMLWDLRFVTSKATSRCTIMVLRVRESLVIFLTSAAITIDAVNVIFNSIFRSSLFV